MTEGEVSTLNHYTASRQSGNPWPQSCLNGLLPDKWTEVHLNADVPGARGGRRSAEDAAKLFPLLGCGLKFHVRQNLGEGDWCLRDDHLSLVDGEFPRSWMKVNGDGISVRVLD